MPSYLLEVRCYWSKQMNKEFAARSFNSEQQCTPTSNKKKKQEFSPTLTTAKRVYIH